MRRNCRIWWPKQLLSKDPSLCNLLFGWFVSCSEASLDIVVAFASNQASVPDPQSGLEAILHNVNGILHESLQEKSMFSLLGQCTAHLSNEQVSQNGMKEEQRKSSGLGGVSAMNSQDICRQDYGEQRCGCQKLNLLVEGCKKASIGSSYWCQLLYDYQVLSDKKNHWIPKLHHIHWNGQIVSQCDVHIIIYETPVYGLHHFSLGIWGSPELLKSPLKKPKWFDGLHEKQPLTNLDTVILAINSASAAKISFDRLEGSKRYCGKTFLVWTLGQILAFFIASLSTMFYIILQFFHCILSFGSQMWMYTAAAKAFSNASVHMRIRCCQILYWPVVLRDNDLRSQSSVEYAEKAALNRHSMWSSLAVDVFLGHVIGLVFLFYAESINLWVLNFASDLTNELLRSGCVWLMGVPAGFKLNTELAGVLGMVSLNAIQIWSTLWAYVGPLFIYFIKGLAIWAILFGVTVPASLLIDTILIATFHVSTLHWLISILYSQQLHALAALWRLFRGRKWNPLRQRLDSYDYTVKQHVVGSLLFAPLLLLLPTTSVFYIFFTIMNTIISLTCILIELIISLIHATPYIKIILWLVKRRRFPSGIWFEIVTCSNNYIRPPESSSVDGSSSHFEGNMSATLITILHGNFLSIGQIVLPHYRKVFSAVPGSYFATAAFGVLTGKRIASSLGVTFPPTMPWMSIPCKDYWFLCHNSILACFADI
ncbi:hypothetical protein SLE2022_256760 [Rubroshorea leprosula]